MLGILAILVSATGSGAQKVGVKSELGFACFTSALKYDFDCPADVLPLDCRCRSANFLATALNCVVEHANNDTEEIANGWHYLRDQCYYWGARTMNMSEMSSIYNQKMSQLVDPTSLNFTVAPGPLYIPDDLYERQLVGTRSTKYNYDVASDMAWGLFGYWALVLLGGIATNAIRVLCPNVYNIVGTRRMTTVRKYLTLPALAGKRHHSPFHLSKYYGAVLPTRGQFFIILGASIFNVLTIVCFLDMKGESPYVFVDQSDRRLHYVANRSGVMAIAQIPFTVLFACRNNPFIYLTGWSYDVFMTHHRWCARWMGTQAIIHAVVIYWGTIKEHAVLFKWHRIYNWRAGNIAVYMVIFMFILATRDIRKRIYETFKALHILMFLTFIICMVVHLSDYGWLGWLYAALAFYGIEYVTRITKVIMSGGIQQAKFTLVEDQMYRIHVPNKNRKWDIKAGSFVYIRILDRDMFWQSHPFSVFQGPESQEDNSMDLCIRAQLGSTRILLQKLIGTDAKTFYKRVMIEGPYGYENYVSDYDSILLFAGGVGFTGMYSFANHIAKQLKPTQYLCLIWVIKDCKSLAAFEAEVVYLARMGEICNFRVFVTRPEELELGTVSKHQFALKDVPHMMPLDQVSTSTAVMSDKEKMTSSSNQESNERTRSIEEDAHSIDINEDEPTCPVHWTRDAGLNLDYGRPNVAAEVRDFIRTANGSKAICACGPPMFVDTIRDGIVDSINDSDARIDYFEDAFSW